MAGAEDLALLGSFLDPLDPILPDTEERMLPANGSTNGLNAQSWQSAANRSAPMGSQVSVTLLFSSGMHSGQAGVAASLYTLLWVSIQVCIKPSPLDSMLASIANQLAKLSSSCQGSSLLYAGTRPDQHANPVQQQMELDPPGPQQLAAATHEHSSPFVPRARPPARLRARSLACRHVSQLAKRCTEADRL